MPSGVSHGLPPMPAADDGTCAKSTLAKSGILLMTMPVPGARNISCDRTAVARPLLGISGWLGQVAKTLLAFRDHHFDCAGLAWCLPNSPRRRDHVNPGLSPLVERAESNRENNEKANSADFHVADNKC